MSLETVRLKFALSRRQQWAAHLGVWMAYPVALVGVTATQLAVVALSYGLSAWFLLLLCVPLPPFNNIPRLIGGFLQPLLYGRQRMEVVIEHDRLGYSSGRGQVWRNLENGHHIHRFRDDLWTIDFFDGALVSIPVSAIDEQYIQHVRTRGEQETPTS